MLPPTYIVNNDFSKEQVREYLKSRVFDASWFFTRQIHEAKRPFRILHQILEILSVEVRQIQTLIIEDLPSFWDESNFMLESIVELKCFCHLKYVRIRHLRLKAQPDFSLLDRVRILDIRENEIMEINENLLPPNVTEIDITGNPIQCVAIDCKQHSSLSLIICGSQQTHYISYSILCNIQLGNLKVKVPSRFEEHLFLPQCHIFNNPKLLSKYVGNPFKFVHIFLPPAYAIDNTENLLEHLHFPVVSLHDSSRTRDLVMTKLHLCAEYTTLRNCHNIVSSFFQNLTFLALSSYEKNCSQNFEQCFAILTPVLEILILNYWNITSVPDLTKFIHLKGLHLDYNNINKFENLPQSLESMSIVHNPLRTIEIGKSIPLNLKKLICGSAQMRVISLPLLKESRENLVIEIPERYREYLSYPSYEVLGSPEHLDDYIEGTTEYQQHKLLVFLGDQSLAKTLIERLQDNESCRFFQTDILKVFGITVREGVKVTAYDFTDQDMLTVQFPILFRDQHLIAVVAIDAAVYCQGNHDETVTKWVERCVFYSDCKIILVLFNTGKSLDVNVDNLKKLIENWRREERKYYSTMQERKANAEVGQDEATSMYDEIGETINRLDNFDFEIVDISFDQEDSLLKLKEVIATKIEFTHVSFPEGWIKIRDLIKKSKPNFCTTFKTIIRDESLKGTNNLVRNVEECLRHLRAQGTILWYETYKGCIFLNIDTTLKYITQIFALDTSEKIKIGKAWKHTKSDFESAVKMFQKSALLSRDFLNFLVKPMIGDADFHRFVALMEENHLCFDSGRGLTKIPWFLGTLRPSLKWPDKIPYSHIELQYVFSFFRFQFFHFQKLTATLQNILKPQDRREDHMDYVFIQRGGDAKLLIERCNAKKVPLLKVRIRGPTSALISLWELCYDTYKVVNSVLDEFYIKDKIFVCPHCILIGRPFESAKKSPLHDKMKSICNDLQNEFCESSADNSKTEVPAALLWRVTTGKWSFLSQNVCSINLIMHSTFIKEYITDHFHC